jgi:hypothetical protein
MRTVAFIVLAGVIAYTLSFLIVSAAIAKPQDGITLTHEVINTNPAFDEWSPDCIGEDESVYWRADGNLTSWTYTGPEPICGRKWLEAEARWRGGKKNEVLITFQFEGYSVSGVNLVCAYPPDGEWSVTYEALGREVRGAQITGHIVNRSNGQSTSYCEP